MPDPFPTPSLDFLNSLKDLLGPDGWKAPATAPRYFDDPRGRFTGAASLIALPRSTAEVAQIVTACSAAQVGIIPYSGGTGVVAGQLSIDGDGAIILSLERMNRIRDISTDDAVMIAEAGCILENIHLAVAEQGMTFPLDMASKGSCCIGGNLATNAGGIQVLRHGNARDLCLGIEAVLPDGSILNALTPLRKNNTGYDLRHLLIGSEGTLGVITAAALTLKPRDPETVTAFLAISSPAAGLAILKELRSQLGDCISALELMSGFGLDLVTAAFPALRMPFEDTSVWALLLEVSGPAGLYNRTEATLATCLETELAQDAIIAQSDAQRGQLWDLRENTPAANRLAGAFCNSDTSVPLSKVESFITQTVDAITALHPGLQINSYGHIGDGNIHHNVFPPPGENKDAFLAAHPGLRDAVRMAINDVTHANGGSISAEHGIGRLKVDDLNTYGDATKLDLMRRIKTAIDPKGIMNPGALLG